jgi:hypothetical protein
MLHHLEAEFAVMPQINPWIDKLMQLPQRSPEEKKAYDDYVLRAPFNHQNIRKMLTVICASPSPLWNRYQEIKKDLVEEQRLESSPIWQKFLRLRSLLKST